ncbi:hypothetical protein EVJ58_g8981 [Rhodofomes roseus]|uniref:MYND-type domain-containing protein n=1 Tax=Rhodofomes roseus TaxID=34475 RepID=A0A4Y9XVS1_9APHY|nr:hypothetical protein EVJ58_g8981 [Rhodofomes roseus]
MSLSADAGDVALLFASSLQDPARPKHCARVLCGCLHLFDGRNRDDPYALYERYTTPDNENYEGLRRLHPECLDASVAFLSLVRSAKEEDDLDALLSTCACPSASDENTAELLQWLHAFEVARQFTLRDFTEALLRHLSGVLHSTIQTRTVGGTVALGGITKHRRNLHVGSPLWPTDASLLLPRGIEESMKGYAASFHLCRQERFQEALGLAATLIAICGRSIIHPLLQFQPVWPSRIALLAAELCHDRMKTLGESIDHVIQREWMCTLFRILEFCRAIIDPGKINPLDIDLFVSQCMTVSSYKSARTNQVGDCGLLLACDTILGCLSFFSEDTGTDLFRDVIIDQFTVDFSLIGAFLYRHKTRDDTTVYHPAILAVNTEAEARYSDPVNAFAGFCWASVVRHCCAPECREEFATAGRAFARCSGCDVLRYCSRLCLARAWKHTLLPHKAVCTKLRILRERTNLPRDRDLDPLRDREPFIEACRADEGLAALALDCGEYFIGLLRAIG